MGHLDVRPAGGLLIGYYANQRSNRRAGPWRRILVNGLFAGIVTGLTAAALCWRSRRSSSTPTTATATRVCGGPIAVPGGPTASTSATSQAGGAQTSARPA
jgi:hypothetical protein